MRIPNPVGTGDVEHHFAYELRRRPDAFQSRMTNASVLELASDDPHTSILAGIETHVNLLLQTEQAWEFGMLSAACLVKNKELFRKRKGIRF